MLDVADEGVRRGRSDDDYAPGQDENDGVGQIGAEQAEAAELTAVVESGETKQASVADNAPGGFADGGIGEDSVKAN